MHGSIKLESVLHKLNMYRKLLLKLQKITEGKIAIDIHYIGHSIYLLYWKCIY